MKSVTARRIAAGAPSRASAAPAASKQPLLAWPIAGSAGPYRAARSHGSWASGEPVPDGLGRGQRGVGGPGVVGQRRDHGRGHDPAVAGLRVDHPQLHVPVRADRREQRGQVVIQVLGGRRAQRPGAALAQPVAEGHPGRRGPVLRPRLADAHELGVQRVRGPRVARVTVGPGRSPGPARIHVGPHLLPGRTPAGRLPVPQRGVGERGHQHRPDRVQQPPAGAVTGRARAVVAGVQAHLDGRGAAHHLAAPRAFAVEEFLHRGVPREIEQAAGRAERVEAVAAELEAGRRGCVTQCGQVTPGDLVQLTQGSGGSRAELELPAWLERERGTRGKFIRNGLGCLPQVAFIACGPEAGQGSGYLFRLDR